LPLGKSPAVLVTTGAGVHEGRGAESATQTLHRLTPLEYLRLAQGYTAAHPDGAVIYTAHERHVCASLLIASGASDMQVARQMGTARSRQPRTSTGTCSPRTAPPSLTP
jgi:hypothetical protein